MKQERKNLSKEYILKALREFKRENETKISISSGSNYRPTPEDIESAISSLKHIKNILVRSQDYDNSAKIRDVERVFINLMDAHPEQGLSEKFLMNFPSEGVEEFLHYKLPDHISSARVGIISYEEGTKNKLEGHRPIFVTLKDN